MTEPTADPLADAIRVLERIDISKLSINADTDDAANRIVIALGYLRLADEGRGESES